MLKLITGTPGAGKTQYALSQALKEKRTVYTANIPLLKRPDGWKELDPKEWEKAESGALIIIDEAQDYMMASQKECEHWIKNFAKHRHYGLDIWLITQDPKQIHAYVRRLVGEWTHLTRMFGQNAANVVVRATTDERKPELESKLWPYNKDVWEMYHSATIHTKHGRVPWKLVAGALGIIFAIVGVVWGISKSGVTDIKKNWTQEKLVNKENATSDKTTKPGLLDKGTATTKDAKQREARITTPEGVTSEKTCPVLVGVLTKDGAEKSTLIFKSQDGTHYTTKVHTLMLTQDEFLQDNKCRYYIADGSLYTRDAEAREANRDTVSREHQRENNKSFNQIELVQTPPQTQPDDTLIIVGNSGPHDPSGGTQKASAPAARNARPGR